MKKFISLILLVTTANLLYVQAQNTLTIRQIGSNKGIKNVNIWIPKLDTILITDTAGVIDISGISDNDTLIIKKFGYEKQVIISNQKTVLLRKDYVTYSHNIKLLDLTHKDGVSFIKLSINGDVYWFKQKVGPLFLGNGRELENGQEYTEIFRNHKIIKTVSVACEYCLWRIRSENPANWITTIYYDPNNKKRKTKYIPGTSWHTKREMRKDTRILNLETDCLK